MVLQAKTVEKSFSRNNEHNLLRRTDILGKCAVGWDQAPSTSQIRAFSGNKGMFEIEISCILCCHHLVENPLPYFSIHLIVS